VISVQIPKQQIKAHCQSILTDSVPQKEESQCAMAYRISSTYQRLSIGALQHSQNYFRCEKR